MPNPLLLSGPAGGGKTQAARALLLAATGPLVVSDFQAIYAALILLERNPDGRYPERNPAQAAWLLPLTEYVRQAVIRGAAEMDVETIVTNSDGSAARRAYLLSRLGPGAVERVIDPGIDVVTQRLGRGEGLSDQCQEAVNRWFSRK